MEGVDLDWKVKTFFLIFAPCTQLTFLGAFIYFWMYEKSEEKEVGIVIMLRLFKNKNEIQNKTKYPICISSGLSYLFVENVPFPVEAG